MKRQRQGVRSTRVREETEPNVPATPKVKDVYIKVHNAMETMHIDRGCTGEIAKKKIFSEPFFSQCNLVDMVCRMYIHQDGF